MSMEEKVIITADMAKRMTMDDSREYLQILSKLVEDEINDGGFYLLIKCEIGHVKMLDGQAFSPAFIQWAYESLGYKVDVENTDRFKWLTIRW